MNLYTEKEQLLKNQEFAYRLRNLYLTDKKLFNQVVDYVPYSVFTNEQETYNIKYCNTGFLEKGTELEKLVEKGFGYLSKISCPVLFKDAVSKAENFKSLNDKNGVCSYWQNLRVNGELNYFYASKLFLNDNLYFNIGGFISELGNIGNIFKKVFDSATKNETNWLQFKSLTKKEKIILKLISEGNSTADISDNLFISKHTVQAHRKNIYKKLNAKSIVDLVHFSLALEILKE